MTDREHRSPEAGDIDTGERIAELAALAEEPSSGFLQQIRRSIQRRVFTADALDFGLMGFFSTFFGYVTLMVQGMVGPEPRNRDKN
jgi:hypothetical protein